LLSAFIVTVRLGWEGGYELKTEGLEIGGYADETLLSPLVDNVD